MEVGIITVRVQVPFRLPFRGRWKERKERTDDTTDTVQKRGLPQSNYKKTYFVPVLDVSSYGRRAVWQINSLKPVYYCCQDYGR